MIGKLSLTARLTALFSLVSASVLLGLALLIGQAVDRHFEEEDYTTLADQAGLVRRIAAEPSAQPLEKRLADALQNHTGFVVQLKSSDGVVLYATSGFDFRQQWRNPASGAGRHTSHSGGETEYLHPITGQQEDLRYRAIQTQVLTHSGQRLELILGTDTEMHDHFTREFRRTLAYYVGLAALLSGVFGWWAARRGLLPLRGMATRAAAVTAQRLDERMEVEAMPVEMRELARNLNAMLARLQQDFTRLSEFSSDLAHELRTPITNLMTQTQVVLSQARSPAKYQEVLESNAEELQRLARMVSDMLYLARVEQDITLAHPEPLNLRAEVQALFDFYEALAEERGVRLAVTGDAAIIGDRLMVRRALGNLLSNALRYTPPSGGIAVTLVSDPDKTTVIVENDGQDIPEELLPSLFDRFFRGDKSRVRSDLDGVGLGLAITRAIAKAHGGDIKLRSTGGKTSFILSFRLAWLAPD